MSVKNTESYIIDNGQQPWTILKNNVIHTTRMNVGCAGIWNIAADIGFKHFGEDKIVISNDDNYYTDHIIDQLFEKCNENTIVGTYDRSFEFSLFAIHKNTFNKVGRFDENCMFVTEEDIDYKIRCKLNNITIDSLNLSAQSNLSMSSILLSTDQKLKNIEYINRKWGIYRNYTTPFAGHEPVQISIDMLNEYATTYGSKWPSISEFERFLKNNQS